MASDAKLSPTRDESRAQLPQDNGLPSTVVVQQDQKGLPVQPGSGPPGLSEERLDPRPEAKQRDAAQQPSHAETDLLEAPEEPSDSPASESRSAPVTPGADALDAGGTADAEVPGANKVAEAIGTTDGTAAPAERAHDPVPDALPAATPDRPVAQPASQRLEKQESTADLRPQPEMPNLDPSGGSEDPDDAADSTAEEDEPASPANYEELLADYSQLSSVRAGDICRGRVVSVTPDGVVVDIGGKAEGIVPIDDFFAETGEAQLPDGDDIDVWVERPGALGEYAILSYKRARQHRLWEEVEEAYRSKKTIEGRVVGRVKGGLQVDVGTSAFLPGSQVDLNEPEDLDSLVGTTVPVRVVKINKRRANVVVSRRALLEDELRELKLQTLSKLEEGAVVEGTVKNLTDYGAFVDLGGIDGLLHVTDISWGRIQAPSEVLKPGEKITAKVIKFDAEKERVSLSLKQLVPDPWEGLAERYHAGGKVTGKVTSVNDYGAFVELEKGIEGLIHVSELSWSKRLKHPSKVLKLGAQIEAAVLKVEPDARRISLSLKQCKPDPWLGLDERYRIGTIVEGRVRNLASYGAFVEIEEGVEGLIHVSDLSWDRRLKHPNEVLTKGRTAKAVVMHVDCENRRLSLGIKQLQPDNWENFFSCHLVGDVITGSVTRNVKFGVFVELAPGVEGLCHSSELPRHANDHHKTQLRPGKAYQFKIIKLDEFGKKIGLSRRGVLDEAEMGTAQDNGSVSAPPVQEPAETLEAQAATQP